MIKNHPSMIEDEYFKPHLQAVISIPQKAPEGAITRDESAMDLLSRVNFIHKNWIKPGHRSGHNANNVSATISIKETEWNEVGDWMWAARNSYTALSILPYSEHSYIQAPFEDCTEDEYNEQLKHLNQIDLTSIREEKDETVIQDTVACGGNSCEIT